jgi:hypothetical protein
MKGTRLKVISSESASTFEFETNAFLAELDAQGLAYDLSFCSDQHCVYISFSQPKLNIPIERTDGRRDYCRICPDFDREHVGCDAYCNFHRRKIKFGGFCCAEYYERFQGVQG